MTDTEIQAEIARQVHAKLALLAIMLRTTGQEHGPATNKTLRLIADEMDKIA